MRGLIELVLTVAIAVVLALLIQAFIVKPYRIPSPSMVPTLDIGQRVLTNRLAGNPGIGDIVVFHPPHGADFTNPVCGNPDQGGQQGGLNAQACDEPTPQESSQTFIKRVVGLPGDTIRIVNGHVIRNGVPREGLLHRALRRTFYLQFRESDQDSARRLLHDGGQPPGFGGQSLLGPHPEQMDHRHCVLHVLAA